MNYDHFICICCGHNPLDVAIDGLICSACGKEYPLQRGVPVFFPDSKLSVKVNKREISIDDVTDIYNRAYDHDGLMGTDLDKVYDRTTKTNLLDFARPLDGKRLLDVGTGIGNLWDYIPETVEGFALDPSVIGAYKAWKRFPHLTVSASLGEYLPYPREFFDVVIAADTIEHTFSPEQTISEIYRVLRTGGVFSGSFPISDSLRKWGFNQLIKRNFSIPFLINLGKTLIRRTLLFGRAEFQVIDRDLPLQEWKKLIIDAGFNINKVIEWPCTPEEPIVYLIQAAK